MVYSTGKEAGMWGIASGTSTPEIKPASSHWMVTVATVKVENDPQFPLGENVFLLCNLETSFVHVFWNSKQEFLKAYTEHYLHKYLIRNITAKKASEYKVVP